jgi:hypothetical protein
MQKSLLIGLVAGAIGVTLPASSSAAIATPYVAGDFQGWNAGSNPMTESAPGSGVWALTVPGLAPNSRHEFKITNGTWDQNFPGANSWFFADALGSITITYDANTYSDGWSPTSERLGLSTDPGSWTAVGNWQNQVGGADWNNADPNTVMSPLGGGLYEYTATLAPGNYLWKSVVSGSWDSISWDNRSVGTADWGFSTDANNNVVTFRVDALRGVAQITIVPEPSVLALLGLAGSMLVLRRRS